MEMLVWKHLIQVAKNIFSSCQQSDRKTQDQKNPILSLLSYVSYFEQYMKEKLLNTTNC